MVLQHPVKRRKRRTTDSQHDFPRYPNLVSDLKPSRPCEGWVANITDVRLAREFVYLAVLMDVFTRDTRLASEPLVGSRTDVDGSATGTGGSGPEYSPQ